jgi:hypothetical protein
MGYNWNAGMSDRAVEAYSHGKMTAGNVASWLKRKYRWNLIATDVKEHIRYDEWHHTSNHFNMTEFFQKESILEFLSYLENRRLFRKISENRKKENKKTSVVKKYKATIEWLEWTGTRKHPHATECSAELFYTKKNDWLICLRRKNKNTRGLYILNEVEV